MKAQMKHTYHKKVQEGHACSECGKPIEGEGVSVMFHAGIYAETNYMHLSHLPIPHQVHIKTRPLYLIFTLPDGAFNRD